MSITNRTSATTDGWNNFNNFEEILNSLNRQEALCTPGFLLRRQLQTEFPSLVQAAAEKSGKSYDDLTTSDNVPWPLEMLRELSLILKYTNFEKCSSLDIEARHWKKYLSDEERCKRDTAIKMLFALKMNEETANKFLLSNGSPLLSLRNPFDYACKVCLDGGLTYENAVTLFIEFENKHKKTSDTDFTRAIQNETNRIFKKAIISFEEIKPKILKTMDKHADDFCFESPGYSVQNLKRLQVLLKYLTLLYPTDDKNPDGTPKVLSHLTDAMLIYHGITLADYWDLPEYGGPENLQPRGHLTQLYNNIPFMKKVLIPLKSMSKTLRAIQRAMKKPANAQSVDRDTVILLVYFLMTGWHFAEEKVKNQFQNKLNNDITESKDDNTRKSLLNALKDVIEGLNSIDKNKEPHPKVYAQLINLLLTSFEFNNFYAPFVLDRFVLICLLATEGEQEPNFMSHVIERSYPFSKDILNNLQNNNN